MTVRSKIGLVTAIVAILAAAGPAHADDEIVGVLNLEIEGVSPTAAEKFESSIEEGLVGTGFQVAARKQLRGLLEQSRYIDGCYFGPCLKEVYRNTKVKLVLVARITSLGPSYSFVVSLVDTRSGLPTAQVANMCEVCTLEEAIATATLAVIELVTGSAKVAPTAAVPSTKKPTAKASNQLKRRKRTVRRAALFFVGGALIAGGMGAYFLADDNQEIGYPVVAASGALAVTGVTFLVISGRF